VYVTCSVLAVENDGRIEAFLAGHPGFATVPPADLVAAAPLGDVARARLADPSLATRHGLQMTPRRTGTDGFYVAALLRG
jgi:16S rRNA (cytosine967-C5)-methyltransferase